MDSGKQAYGAPVGGAPPPGPPQPWSTGLCGCFEDGSNCCVTWCCPCITFGRNAEIIDKGTTIFRGLNFGSTEDHGSFWNRMIKPDVVAQAGEALVPRAARFLETTNKRKTRGMESLERFPKRKAKTGCSVHMIIEGATAQVRCCSYGNLPVTKEGCYTFFPCACGQAGSIYYCLFLIGFAACYTRTYRTKLRAYFNLSEDPCNDCLVHYCCLPCALCQEYRELKIRGFDPSQGWIANAEKWNEIAAAGTTKPPSFESGMSR